MLRIMRAYSQDLRDRVLRALEQGEKLISIARRLEVGRGWVHEVRRAFAEEGRSGSRRMGGHRVSRVAALEGTLREWIRQKPDLTLLELCQRLETEHGVLLKIPALWHQLNKWGLSFKKNAPRLRTGAPGREGGQGKVAKGAAAA